MTGIILVALQILLLLLKAHFSKNGDAEKAMQAISQAQDKLSALAADFETKIRYSSPPQDQVERLQDVMDQDRKFNE